MLVNHKYIKDRVKQTQQGCWIWQQYLDADGYGRPRVNGKTYGAHRLSYMVFVGEIPTGMDVDHICFERSCCNPEHLRVLDPAINRRLQRSSLKTECIHGHKLSGDNLYIRPNGARQCKACNLESARKYRQPRITA